MTRRLVKRLVGFNDESVPALEMKIKKLMPVNAESRRLVDWMEKGDSLQKYLAKLLFYICEAISGPMIEEYAFSSSYSKDDGQEFWMDINCTGNKKQGGLKSNLTDEVTPKHIKSSACKMIRTLDQLMMTFGIMPRERTILMKFLYYDDVAPADYEPPFFRAFTDEETQNLRIRNPLRMEVGNVNSKHFVLALKVKSVLDPCEEDKENQDGNVSLGADSVERDDTSESDSEVRSFREDHYIVAPADKPCQDETRIYERSEDPAEVEHRLSRVKDWISSCCLETVENTDRPANFPGILVVLIEEIMDKVTFEGCLSKTGKDTYAVSMQKDFEYEFDVKEEIHDPVTLYGNQAPPCSGEICLYMEALYHTLPMGYITVAKLQKEFDGKANQTTVRKQLDKMTPERFIEATSNHKLGKRVVHSDFPEKKLSEVRKALNVEAMDVDTIGPQNKLKIFGFEKYGNSKADKSTCSVLHSGLLFNEYGASFSLSSIHLPGQRRSTRAGFKWPCRIGSQRRGDGDGDGDGGLDRILHLSSSFIPITEKIEVQELYLEGPYPTPEYRWESGQFKSIGYISRATIHTWFDIEVGVEGIVHAHSPASVFYSILHYYYYTDYRLVYYAADGRRLPDGHLDLLAYLDSFILPFIRKVRVYIWP